MYQNLEKRVWLFKIIFLTLKESLTLLQIAIFLLHYLLHLPSEHWNEIIFAFSYGFKITCIVLRQVISLKSMEVLSAKFTIWISWRPICIPLILLSALMRLVSTSAAVLSNSMDSRHHWQTHIGVKGRRPLLVDSILVCAT